MECSHIISGSRCAQVPVVAADELANVLHLCDDEPLIRRLEQYNHTGRPPYPVSAMCRAVAAKYLLGIRYNVELVALLRSNPAIRDACGFGDTTPNESVVCRFFKRLSRHQDLFEAAIVRLVDRVAAAIRERKTERQPAPGSVVALDSTDIAAWADTCRQWQCDPQARWGIRTNAQAKDSKEYFYGYKMHAICDAYYGIPLGFLILPANQSDSPQLPALVDMVRANHPSLPMRYALADRGYDAMSNYRHLDDAGIRSIILIRNTDKDGLYTTDGRPKCVGGRAMDYVGSHRERGHLFRCPPDGCRLKQRLAFGYRCDGESYENPDEGDLLRRVGRTPRAGRRWRRLYRWRTAVERLFGSLKQSRLLNQHRYRGIRKVRLHAALSTLTYLATMLHRVQTTGLDGMRRMRLPMPAS